MVVDIRERMGRCSFRRYQAVSGSTRACCVRQLATKPIFRSASARQALAKGPVARERGITRQLRLPRGAHGQGSWAVVAQSVALPEPGLDPSASSSLPVTAAGDKTTLNTFGADSTLIMRQWSICPPSMSAE